MAFGVARLIDDSLTGASPHIDAARHGRRKLCCELRILTYRDALHERSKLWIENALHLKASSADSAVQQSNSHQIRQAMVRGLTRARIPLCRLTPDFAVG